MSYTTTISLDQFAAPDNEIDSTELKRLRRTNEVYSYFKDRWDFYLAAYEGGEEFAKNENLFRHQRENEMDFEDRCARVHNMNYCEVLVSFFTNFIFAESIDRFGGSNETWYQDFVKNVNKKGWSVDKFMRSVEDDIQVYGMVYLMVDTPPLISGDDPDAVLPLITKQDELDLGLSPYWVSIKPDEVTDWTVDDFGRVSYLKRCQYTTRVDETGKMATLEKYTEFYSYKTVVTEVDVTKRDKPVVGPALTYPNQIGKVPFIVGRFQESKRYPHIGLSFLRDFAYNQREIMNLTSLIQEFLYRQCFNMLAKEVDNVAPMKEAQDGLLGTNNVIEFPKGAHAPSYISPPTTPAQALQEERQRIKNEMFIRASQDAMNELFNGEGKSGFSQAQSFAKTVPFISSRADELEAVENGLMSLTLQMLGKKWDGRVKYKDRYEITNLMDALTQFQVLVKDLQITSEEFVKSQLKRFVHQFDGKMSVEQQAKVDEQIDAINFTKWAEVQKQALVGSPTSPGEQQQPKDTLTLSEVQKESRTTTSATTKLKD